MVVDLFIIEKYDTFIVGVNTPQMTLIVGILSLTKPFLFLNEFTLRYVREIDNKTFFLGEN